MTSQRRLLLIALALAVALLLGSVVLAVRVAALSDAVAAERAGPAWHRPGPGPQRVPPQAFSIDQAEARRLAAGWLSEHRPGTELGPPRLMRHGYTFAMLAAGRTIGLVMVDGRTGRVFGHEWSEPRNSRGAT